MDLAECRKQIDKIDDQLLPLFIERMKIAADVAKYKEEHNIATLNTAREQEILDRVAANAGEHFAGYTKLLFSTLFELSRSYQKSLRPKEGSAAEVLKATIASSPEALPEKAKVACQGVRGAFSQQACNAIFKDAEITYVDKFSGVFEAVANGSCRYGILPIENNSAGTVDEVYDLMRNYNFYIVKAAKLQVRHSLLAKPGVKISDIREVFSHRQAIRQCSDFLNINTRMRATIAQNTALAAKAVADSDDRTIAAIASSICAPIYGLEVLASDIQNNNNNYTRFICISKTAEIFHGANRVSLVLSLPHQPGALHKIISKIAALGINLTKLESRPIPGRNFEFMFYFDLEAPLSTPGFITLLDELNETAETFVFLGAYNEFGA